MTDAFGQPAEGTYPPNFNLDKKALIDFVFQRLGYKVRSFADLGGVWAVDAAYTFYTLDTYAPSRAYLVDTNFTEAVAMRSEHYPNLTTIEDNFGDRTIPETFGRVDSIFLFDVLLHQVKPDWDEILEMYAPITPCFVIYNQQWINHEKTVRLLDLGYEGYFANVPHDRNHPTYKTLFEKMYEMHPEHNRIWRDIHNCWQWGITDADLIAKLQTLGFTMQYYINCGRFGPLENFENHAFVFKKS
jgi:hypothetical protein